MKIKLEDLKLKDNDIDLDEYIEFREYVKSYMEYPEWLGDFTKNQLEEMLKEESKIYVYYKDEEPVCSMMMIPSTKKDMDSFNFNLDYNEVMDYGPIMVNPKYVGNNLGYQMLLVENNYSKKNGYNYAVATIHPDNIYSINILEKDNFEEKGQKVFKRGIRNIYFKKL